MTFSYTEPDIGISWDEFNYTVKLLNRLSKLTFAEVNQVTIEWFTQPIEIVEYGNQFLYFQRS